MSTVLITGGTGTIGKAISKALIQKGHEVIILTRNAAGTASSAGLSYAEWNPAKGQIDAAAFSKADHIIHLAGAGVADERWTSARKKEIRDSRVLSGELLVRSLTNIPNKVISLISSSAIGWYGPDPQIPNPAPFRETAPCFPGFLGDTCREWEASVSKAEEKTRLVIIRTGIVLANEGGALKEFKKPLQFKMAAILGNGKQMISWIHMDDLVSLFINAMEDSAWTGIYNGVAPSPVSNKTLALTLAKEKGGAYFPFHVPAFLLKLIMGEMSIEVLKSATVSADKVVAAGFQFRFNEINDALKDLWEKS